MIGWISIYRSLAQHDLWLSEKFTRGQAWVDLIMLANHKQSYIYIRGNKVGIERGQVGWSEQKLAERWKWSKGKVRRYIDELQDEEQIIQQKNNIMNRISIINYDKYQKNGPQTDLQTELQTVQQTDTNNNNNKVNNRRKRKEFVPPTLSEVQEFFQERGYSQTIAKTAYDGYSVADWEDTNGKQIKNWKQKMIMVWFKPENLASVPVNGPAVTPAYKLITEDLK